MPYLCEKDLLSTNEVDNLLRGKAGNSRSYHILHALTVLDKKGSRGVFGLIAALKEAKCHAGHDDLAEILVTEYYTSKSSRFVLVILTMIHSL